MDDEEEKPLLSGRIFTFSFWFEDYEGKIRRYDLFLIVWFHIYAICFLFRFLGIL